MEAYLLSLAMEGVGDWASKGGDWGGDSQEDEKSKCLVNKCLSGHADKSS